MLDRLAELVIIKEDIFHFLKYVKIQEPGKLRLDYELWPHLATFYKELEDNRFIDLIKAKQIGISWALAIYALWKIYTIPGWNVLEISKGQIESQELLAKSKVVYHNLPDWMKVYTLDPNSTERFGFKEMRSKITALPSTETAGIGETAGLVIHDEAEFHDFYEINLSHTRATVADSSDRQLISATTTNKEKPDSYFKNHWRAANEGKNGFKALFRGFDVRPGRDEAFYAQMVRENENTPWVVEQNWPRSAEEALSPQSASSCFNKDKLTDLWDNRCENPEVEQGCIYILCSPRVGTHYVAGIDVGEGVGLDYSVLSIVGKYGLQSEVCAVIYSNTLGTAEFAYESDRLCRKYFNPLLVVDNIGLGKAVVDKLVELGYLNLFSQEADEKRKQGKEIKGNEKIGWALTRPNKRELAGKLIEVINDGSLVTRFKPQIKELMEYQWINNYPEPTGRTHGDTVISLMLANQVLKDVGSTPEIHAYKKGRRLW